MNKEFAGSEGKEREVILEIEGKGGNLDILMNWIRVVSVGQCGKRMRM